jgi:hypothetical protein
LNAVGLQDPRIVAVAVNASAVASSRQSIAGQMNTGLAGESHATDQMNGGFETTTCLKQRTAWKQIFHDALSSLHRQ